MPYINKDYMDRLIERQKTDGDLLLQTIEDFAEGKRREGVAYKFTCPACGSHSLSVTPGKMVFKCFNCNEISGKSAINFLMSKAVGKDLPAAVEYVAQAYNEAVQYDEPVKREPKKARKAESEGAAPSGKSFCARMLESSGLTGEDITARVKLDREQEGFQTVRTFQKGGLDERYNVDPEQDDMIIRYYDLDGNPCTFIPNNDKTRVKVEREYFRVRFQFPEAHRDKLNKPMKYRSPVGAPVFIYYPECIREIYRKKEQLDTLFIQEGEKKAEKARLMMM